MMTLENSPRAEPAASPSPRTTYTVEPADLERDRETFLEVKRRNFPHIPYGIDEYRWYFQENPLGTGRIWLVVAYPEERVVGVAGLGVRRLRIGSETYTVGLASDFAVDKEHRSLMPALMLQKAVAASASDAMPVIYGTPNKNAQPVFRRIGYKEVGAVQRWVKPLRVGPYLRKLSGSARFAAPLGGAIDLTRRVSARLTVRRTPGLKLTRFDRFDTRFDQLWDENAGAEGVLVERRSEYLNWRFADCPYQRYTSVGLMSKGSSRLLGYATYFWRDRHASCSDVFAAPEVTPELLGRLADHVYREGAVSLTVSGRFPRPYTEMLEAQGFSPRTDDHGIGVNAYWRPDFAPIASLDINGWQHQSGDADSD
jgi:hypothetical protein